MEFRLFGHDVEITGSFWLSALLLGVLLSQDRPIYIVIWVLVMLVGVLVHELGHALAFRIWGVRSNIRLHFMGGVTMPTSVLPLSRPALVFISFAGPLAGFVLAGVCAAVLAHVPIAHFGMRETLSFMVSVNIFWSIFNLAPVLPLDGGHILEHALGPRRYRITLGISALAGAGLAIFFLSLGSFIATFIFGSAALQSFLRLREVSEAVRDSRLSASMAGAAADDEAEAVEHGRLSPEVARQLEKARLHIDDGDLEPALAITQNLLDPKGAPKARSTREKSEALGLAALASLRAERTDAAAEAIAEMARLGVADMALLGALALARGDDAKARSILEKAYTGGDTRKDVFGSLIQVLLQHGEVARAAATAFDCFDQLSSDDARLIAEMADEAAPRWSGRLLEAVYEREPNHDDAIAAARAYARAQDGDAALSLLRRAVGAGFDDAARVYGDDRLKGLALESVLPRPS